MARSCGYRPPPYWAGKLGWISHGGAEVRPPPWALKIELAISVLSAGGIRPGLTPSEESGTGMPAAPQWRFS